VLTSCCEVPGGCEACVTGADDEHVVDLAGASDALGRLDDGLCGETGRKTVAGGPMPSLAGAWHGRVCVGHGRRSG
jgi:hypothetical protein